MIQTRRTVVRGLAIMVAALVAGHAGEAVAQCRLGFTLVGETEKQWICERREVIPAIAQLAAEAAKATRRLVRRMSGYRRSFAEAARATPAPTTRRTYQDGIILGLLNTPYDAQKFGESAISNLI